MTIYKSPQWETRIRECYDAFQASIPIPVTEQMIDTPFGRTHVLKMGDPHKPPLISFHGGNVFNTADTSLLLPLAQHFHVIAPDTMGHPGKSDQRILSGKNLDFGRWAAAVVSELKIDHARFFGTSFGGGILLHLAAVAPHLIERAAFLVPTGFVRASTFDNLRQFGPALLRFTLRKSDANIRGILKPLYPDAERLSHDEMTMFRAIFTGVKLSTSMPRIVTKEELTGFTAPALVIAAEQDVMCPARKVLERAQEVLPTLTKGVLLEGAPHMAHYYTDHRQRIEDNLVTFMCAP